MIKHKAADTVRLLYNFYPEEAFDNQHQQTKFISAAIQKLVEKGKFLGGGHNEQVCPLIQYIANVVDQLLYCISLGSNKQPHASCSQGGFDFYLQIRRAVTSSGV